MSSITLSTLLNASAAGGPSCLTSTTELQPAGGQHCSVAPAKFALRGFDTGVYAYERRFLDGAARTAVIIDSKQSQLNRAELALQQAIDDGHPILSRLPHVAVRYDRDGTVDTYTDLMLPHRVFDGHIRAGTVDGTDVTALDTYRAVRDASPVNARALLETSSITLVFGGWDSSRRSRQGRWRSALVGEIIGFCADGADERDHQPKRGGARVDPVGMQINLTDEAYKEVMATQRHEMSPGTYKKLMGSAAQRKPSALGLGGVPPSLEQLAGVACDRILRSHVLSFAALRQMRFGAGTEGDAACRALLAALALNGLARSDAELNLRANCDLREAGAPELTIDRRDGDVEILDRFTIDSADALLADALAHAEQIAQVRWQGLVLDITGNPAIIAGAVDDADEAGTS